MPADKSTAGGRKIRHSHPDAAGPSAVTVQHISGRIIVHPGTQAGVFTHTVVQLDLIGHNGLADIGGRRVKLEFFKREFEVTRTQASPQPMADALAKLVALHHHAPARKCL